MCCRRKGSQRSSTASGCIQSTSFVDSRKDSLNFELAYPQIYDADNPHPEVAAVLVQMWRSNCDSTSPECKQLLSATLVCEATELLSVPPSAVSDDHGNAASFGVKHVTMQDGLEPRTDPPTLVAIGIVHLDKSASVSGGFASVQEIASVIQSPAAKTRITAAVNDALSSPDFMFHSGLDPMHQICGPISRVALLVAPGKAPAQMTESELDEESRRNQYLEKQRGTEQRGMFGAAPWMLQEDDSVLSDKDFIPHMDQSGRLYPPSASFPAPEPNIRRSRGVPDAGFWQETRCAQESLGGPFAFCSCRPGHTQEAEGDSPRLVSTALGFASVTRPDGEVRPATLEGLMAPSIGGRLAPTGGA